jgi:hypothetical protein
MLSVVVCLCGCGRKLPRGLIDANFWAGEMGLELLAWDRARVGLDAASADAERIGRIVAAGAGTYQGALEVLHGERPQGDLGEEVEAWLRSSRAARREMAADLPALSAGKIKLNDAEVARFDPLRPELSFTGGRETDRPEPAASEPAKARAASESADEDPVAQLRGLRELHAAGALTDEEFAAAKARVIARL